MADSDFPLFVANARLLKAFDSVGLHVGIALANKAATSNKYKEVVKSLISQSVDTDETIQSAEWYVDEDKFENAYLREYMIGTSDAANEWGSCKNHCKLHQEPCKVHVCIHVSLLHNMQDIEDLDPLSFKVKGSDSQDPLAWLEFLSGSQLAHAFLVCVILLHELAHLLHYQSCVWLRTKIEMYFDELGQHIFPLANAQSPSCPHSGPTTFDSTLQCTAPKYMDGVLLTDLGEMVEQKVLYFFFSPTFGS